MRKLFNYPGSKTRELDTIIPLMPSYDTLVEPFAGGAALSFRLAGPHTHLNELDPRLINFYEVCQDPALYTDLKNYANHWTTRSQADVKAEYFRAQSTLDVGTPLERAKSFVMYRQMAISGIYRTSRLQCRKKKRFAHNLTWKHHLWLKTVTLTNLPYEKCLAKHDNPGTFLFVDPPYLDTKDYPINKGVCDWRNDLDLHTLLRDRLANLKHAKWMVVHKDNPHYRTLYAQYNIIDQQVLLGHFMNSARIPAKQLYITNY